MTKVLTITVPDDLTLGLVMRVYDFMVDEHGIEASEVMFDDSTKGFKCFRICYESKNQEQVAKFEEFVLNSIKRIKTIEKWMCLMKLFHWELANTMFRNHLTLTSSLNNGIQHTFGPKE